MAEASRKRRDSIMTDPGVVEVRPVYYMPDVSYPFLATGTILVRVTDDLTVAEVVGLWDDYHLDFVEPVDGLPGVYCVKTKSIDEDEVFRAQVMSNDDRVVWAQPNMRSPVILHQAQQEVTPSDPLFGRQWHLDNTGQDGGTAEADISARAAWTISGGSDVLIGGFDDGCDVNHEDLDQNYLGIGHDPTLLSTNSDSNNPEPKQIGDRHGTAVMGLAVSVGNLEGGRGVSFLSRFTLSRGASEFTTPQQKASVYTFARQQNVDVHINSWGLDEDEPIPSVLEEAINVAFEDGRDPDGEAGSQPPRGMVIVFAAGNLEDGQGNDELPTGQVLATLNSVIGVGASTNNDTLADYSRFGPGIEFLAPGGSEEFGILTTDNDDDNIVVDDGYNIAGFDADGEADVDGEGLYTEEFLGTSASCPIAAGVAALVLSENPALSATAVRTTLEHTCDRVSPADADYDNITGRSLLYGYGRVNAFKAVQAARDASENGGLTWPGGVSNLVTAEDDMSWDSGSGTREFMVIESTGDFAFDFNADNPFPVDGVCYSEEQLGCDSAAIEDLPNGVSLTAITGCAGSNCGNGEDVLLENMVQQGNSYAV
ncbi:MAG: S8 family serine peptidase, partial [Planctomycetota bacterium]